MMRKVTITTVFVLMLFVGHACAVNEVWLDAERDVTVGDIVDVHVHLTGEEHDSWFIGSVIYDFNELELLSVVMGDGWNTTFSDVGEVVQIDGTSKEIRDIQSFRMDPTDEGQTEWVTISFKVLDDSETCISVYGVDVWYGDQIPFDFDYKWICINGDDVSDGGGYNEGQDSSGSEPINLAPNCDTDLCPKSGLSHTDISFDASLCTDDSGIVSYQWDFGDGGTITTDSPFVSHNYSVSGNYTVTLTVVDEDGLTDNENFNIFVTAKESPHIENQDGSTLVIIVAISIVAVSMLALVVIRFRKKK